VARNVGKFGDEATADWTTLRTKLEWVPDARTSIRPLLLTASKDKPVLISALAGWTVVRLTDVHITTPILERLVKFVRGRCAVAGPGTLQSTPSRGRA